MRSNYTGEPASDRTTIPLSPQCVRCQGPCKLPEWTRDGSVFSNDPDGFAAHISRVHSWFEPAWTRGVERARQMAIDAPAPRPTFSCSSCGRFSFAEPTLCFWCKRTKGGVAADSTI